MTTSTHNPNLTMHHIRKNNRKRNKLTILGGGLGGQFWPYAIQSNSSSIIGLDVPGETEKNKEALQTARNVHTIKLGDNHTSKSLLSRFIPKESTLFESIGTSLSDKGLGQLRGLGCLAATEYVRSGQFQQLVDQLRIEYLLTNNGMFPPPSLNCFGSLNGGVNSGASPVLIKAIQQAFAAFGVPVEANFHMVDSTSYTGLGKNIDVNCAQAIDTLLSLVTEVNHSSDSNCVINLRLISLPPTGSNDQGRAQLALLETQAWSSEELQEWHQITGPNMAHSHALGNVYQTNAEYFRSIPTEAIVNELVRAYSWEIHDRLQKASPAIHTIRQIDAVKSAQSLPRRAIDELVALGSELSVDEFISAVQAPAASLHFNLLIEDIRGRQFDCDLLPDFFVSPSQSLDDAIDDLVAVLTVREKLVKETTDLAQNVRTLKKKACKFQKQVRRLKNRRTGLLSSNGSNLAKLNRSASQLRKVTDEIRETMAVRDEVEKCIKVASELHARQRSVIESLLQMLDAHKVPNNDFELHGLIYFQPTNEVYGKLLEMLPTSKKTQSQLLAMAATAVTEEGLKYILKTNSSDSHHIAAVVTGEAFIPGAWIAGLGKTPDQSIVVFPRMSSALGASLRREIQKIRPDWLVFFTDSCALGANVVRINICYPKSKDECIPGYLGQLLRETNSTPLSVLNSISNTL